MVDPLFWPECGALFCKAKTASFEEQKHTNHNRDAIATDSFYKAKAEYLKERDPHVNAVRYVDTLLQDCTLMAAFFDRQVPRLRHDLPDTSDSETNTGMTAGTQPKGDPYSEGSVETNSVDMERQITPEFGTGSSDRTDWPLEETMHGHYALHETERNPTGALAPERISLESWEALASGGQQSSQNRNHNRQAAINLQTSRHRTLPPDPDQCRHGRFAKLMSESAQWPGLSSINMLQPVRSSWPKQPFGKSVPQPTLTGDAQWSETDRLLHILGCNNPGGENVSSNFGNKTTSSSRSQPSPSSSRPQTPATRRATAAALLLQHSRPSTASQSSSSRRSEAPAQQCSSRQRATAAAATAVGEISAQRSKQRATAGEGELLMLQRTDLPRRCSTEAAATLPRSSQHQPEARRASSNQGGVRKGVGSTPRPSEAGMERVSVKNGPRQDVRSSQASAMDNRGAPGAQKSREAVLPQGSARKSAPRPRSAYGQAQPSQQNKKSGFEEWRNKSVSHRKSLASLIDEEQEDDPVTSLKESLQAMWKGCPDVLGWQTRQHARDMNMPLESVALAKEVFSSFDVDGSGTLDLGELEAAALKLIQLTTDCEHENLNCDSVSEWSYWGTMNCDGINFEEFIQWYASHSFKEDILLSRDQQKLRQIAKRHGVSPDQVERVKKSFDACTKDSSEISFEEFSPIIHDALQVPLNALPESRLRFFWSQIDVDLSGKICFVEFFDWWILCFPKESPYEGFYRSVRRIGKDHLDPSPYSATAGKETPNGRRNMVGVEDMDEKEIDSDHISEPVSAASDSNW